MTDSTGGESLEQVADIIKCLGHPLRLRILDALEDGEMTVSELQERVGEQQATVSRQLSTLRGRRVVDSRRDGLNVYYRIIEPRVHTILACIRGCEPLTGEG